MNEYNYIFKKHFTAEQIVFWQTCQKYFAYILCNEEMLENEWQGLTKGKQEASSKKQQKHACHLHSHAA